MMSGTVNKTQAYDERMVFARMHTLCTYMYVCMLALHTCVNDAECVFCSIYLPTYVKVVESQLARPRMHENASLTKIANALTISIKSRESMMSCDFIIAIDECER